jgi:hypothetical protein
MLVGSSFIVELFFLHDRGKCFATYTICILLGTTASSTFSGFIIQTAPWPVQYWYNIGLEGFLALCCVLFLDETGWTRSGSEIWPEPHSNFIRRKLTTYLCIGRCTPQVSSRQILRLGLMPLIIGICPVPLMVGFFILVVFAWAVAITTLTSVYLQTPEVLGGYGFTPNQNAFCKYRTCIVL